MNAPKRSLRIGELLVEKGVVSSDQIRIALTEQRKNRDHLGKILVRLGFATEAIILDVLGGALGHQKAQLQQVVVGSEAIRLIPKDMARRFRILPLTYDANSNRMTLAMADTLLWLHQETSRWLAWDWQHRAWELALLCAAGAGTYLLVHLLLGTRFRHLRTPSAL